jgi:hypothetical protein
VLDKKQAELDAMNEHAMHDMKIAIQCLSDAREEFYRVSKSFNASRDVALYASSAMKAGFRLCAYMDRVLDEQGQMLSEDSDDLEDQVVPPA